MLIEMINIKIGEEMSNRGLAYASYNGRKVLIFKCDELSFRSNIKKYIEDKNMKISTKGIRFKNTDFGLECSALDSEDRKITFTWERLE